MPPLDMGTTDDQDEESTKELAQSYWLSQGGALFKAHVMKLIDSVDSTGLAALAMQGAPL